ncbi:MAG: DUF4136 domain-containing protein [Planctomycetota bacterium]|jgi:hypothetical protein
MRRLFPRIASLVVPALVLLLLLLPAAGLAGCATTDITVDRDPTLSFAGRTTYVWRKRDPAGRPAPAVEEGEPPAGAPQIVADSILDSRIRNAVDTQLAALGFELRPPGTVSPDFLLDYYAATESRVDVMTISKYTDNPAYQYSGGRLRRVYGRQYQDTTTYEYEQGTLILDIVDPPTNRLIWRASAQAEVDRTATQEKRDRRLAEAVAKMLARLPTD